MNKKTAAYIILIVTALACGPCISTSGSVTANELTNYMNMTLYASTQTVEAQQSQSTQVMEAVRETLTAAASSPNDPAVEPGQDSAGRGTVTGNICYPSEGVPAVTIYAQSIYDDSWFSLEYPGGWGEYTFPGIPPGEYIFFAYVDEPGIDFSGGYTAYVTCGMGADCTDHSLLAVHIDAGATVEEIDICDWYGPEGFLPPRP